jgi:sec-independent protein translocase protein TatB
MFGIGFLELIVIAIVAIVFVGPQKLPDLMKQAGRFFVQMRRTTSEVKSTFDQVIRDAENDLRSEELNLLKQVTETINEKEDFEEDGIHNADGTLIASENIPHDSESVPNELHKHSSEINSPSFDTQTKDGESQDSTKSENK